MDIFPLRRMNWKRKKKESLHTHSQESHSFNLYTHTRYSLAEHYSKFGIASQIKPKTKYIKKYTQTKKKKKKIC
jgi:hypothetical protein